MRGAEGPLGKTYTYGWPNFGFDAFALTAEPTRTCARCHGQDGGGSGVFPNLAIQDRTYLADSLRAFASGTRRSAYMQVVASQLSPAQIESLAGYYSGQARRRADAAALQPSVTGQQLALNGARARGIGPCAGCHGVTRAVGKAVPRLEGQSRWYLANQMRLFAADGRGSAAPGANPMVTVARKLSDAEIDALATWYAAQPPASVQNFAATP
jgi:cytochrome c553